MDVLSPIEVTSAIVLDSVGETVMSIGALASVELPSSIGVGTLQEALKSVDVLSPIELPSTIVVDGVRDTMMSIGALSSVELPSSIAVGTLQEALKSVDVLSAIELPSTIVLDGVRDTMMSIGALSSVELPSSIGVGTLQEALKSVEVLSPIEFPSTIVLDSVRETMLGIGTLLSMDLLPNTLAIESLQGGFGTLAPPPEISFPSYVEYLQGAGEDQKPAEGMSPLDQELWFHLSTLGSEFQEMHAGAWEAFMLRGPDSQRQAAHSARELLDWVLRSLAPNAVFSEKEITLYGSDGRPTRKMRARYILGRKRDVAFVETTAKLVAEINGSLSDVAHTGVATRGRLRGMLRTCEGVLLILLGRRQRE